MIAYLAHTRGEIVQAERMGLKTDSGGGAAEGRRAYTSARSSEGERLAVKKSALTPVLETDQTGGAPRNLLARCPLAAENNTRRVDMHRDSHTKCYNLQDQESYEILSTLALDREGALSLFRELSGKNLTLEEQKEPPAYMMSEHELSLHWVDFCIPVFICPD